MCRANGKPPILAICYDFDKTLSPSDMQAQGYIQSVGYNITDFWTESNSLAEKNEMDQNLAYMYKMVEESEGNFAFTRERLGEYGAKVALFPGAETWFERIRQFGEDHGVIVEHYIISSGLKEMIEGTNIAKAGAFKKIYASSFYYNERGVAKWPAQVVNYTNKTQFLFRIEKGVLDVNDAAVNDFFAPEDIRIPFRNMVYIGDSDTDIPCMKLVNSFGGHSVGVYNSVTADKAKVYKMMRDGRIKYFAPADYRENAELDLLVKSIIDRTATNESLEAIYYKCKKENVETNKSSSAEQQSKTDLIIALESSVNFARTHSVIRDFEKCDSWSEGEKERLFEIAVSNNQILSILKDWDVKNFYKGLLKDTNPLSQNAQKIKELLT